MALVPRPDWPPLPDPPEPDPATLQEFEVLAAEGLETVDPAVDAAGVGFADLDAAIPDNEAALELLGVDVAAGAVELDTMRAEADADTLELELAAAADQDAALEVLAADVAVAVGETTEPPPPVPPAEPVVAPVEPVETLPVGGGHPAPDEPINIPMDWGDF